MSNSPYTPILQFEERVRVVERGGQVRMQPVTLTIDVRALWDDMAYKAARSKTGRAVIGGGAVKAVRRSVK